MVSLETANEVRAWRVLDNCEVSGELSVQRGPLDTTHLDLLRPRVGVWITRVNWEAMRPSVRHDSANACTSVSMVDAVKHMPQVSESSL